MFSAMPDCSEPRLARKEKPQLMTHPDRLPTTLWENDTTAKSTKSQRYHEIQNAFKSAKGASHDDCLFVHVNIVRRSIMW
jgi:hypothetical protein